MRFRVNSLGCSYFLLKYIIGKDEIGNSFLRNFFPLKFMTRHDLILKFKLGAKNELFLKYFDRPSALCENDDNGVDFGLIQFRKS